MKKTLFLAAALLSALYVSAQQINQAKVPDLIVETFKQKFPKTTDVEWSKKGNAYEVMFDTGFGSGHKLVLDSTGKTVSHIQEIAKGEVPAVLVDAVAKQFPDFRIEDCEKRDIKGVVTYKMEVKGKVEEWKVIFSEDGKLLEKIAD